MKDRDRAKRFTFSKIKNFLNDEKKRVSSKSSFRHSKNRHRKKNSKPPFRFRHEKKNPRPFFRYEKENPRPFFRHDQKNSFISFSNYAKVSSISYSSIKTILSPSQFYQQQSFDSASAFATNASATDFAFSSNSNMPSQFQQSIAYNLFPPQSIGPAASPQQWQSMSTGPTYSSIDLTYQSMSGLTYPAYTKAFYTYSRSFPSPSAFSTVIVPSPSGYAKKIENMKKLYKNDMKYSENNDNFVHKLNIFHHFCDKSDISYETRFKTFSSMFKDFVFDYYLANVNMLKHASLDQLCTFICTHFEKSINVKNNLIK